MYIKLANYRKLERILNVNIPKHILHHTLVLSEMPYVCGAYVRYNGQLLYRLFGKYSAIHALLKYAIRNFS